MTAAPNPPRLLTHDELAVLIRLLRTQRQWSQEQLAEISGVNVRTVQRIECGEGANLHTRRALAHAFGMPDIDALNTPRQIPTAEEFEADQKAFEQEYRTLAAATVVSGRALGDLARDCHADHSWMAFDPSPAVEGAFAALLDYLRDFRDCADDVSETDRIEMHAELQAYLDELTGGGAVILAATDDPVMRFGGALAGDPVRIRILYLGLFPATGAPDTFAAPRNAKASFA
ncbi:MAG: helix-turn-helix transcriptional regulator [Luteibacter sp.]